MPLGNKTALIYISYFHYVVCLLLSVPSLLFCGPERGSKQVKMEGLGIIFPFLVSHLPSWFPFFVRPRSWGGRAGNQMKGQRKVFLFSARRDTWRYPTVRNYPLWQTDLCHYEIQRRWFIRPNCFLWFFYYRACLPCCFAALGGVAKKENFPFPWSHRQVGWPRQVVVRGPIVSTPMLDAKNKKKIVNILVIYFLSVRVWTKMWC